MVRRGLRFAVAAAVAVASLIAIGRPALAQAKDPLIGTWNLDVTKSTYTGAPAGNPPFKREMTFVAVANGIKHTTITRDALGAANTTDYTAKFDGKDYPASVESALDTLVIKRIDANTIERTGKIKDEAVETVTFAVSPDGKVLTVTQKGNVAGIAYSSVQVFNRK